MYAVLHWCIKSPDVFGMIKELLKLSAKDLTLKNTYLCIYLPQKINKIFDSFSGNIRHFNLTKCPFNFLLNGRSKDQVTKVQ